MYFVITVVTASMVFFVVEFANLNKHNIEEDTLYSKIDINGFQVIKNDKWENFFVKGINIGAALPGKWFTEFPRDEKIYFDWLEKIGQINANCIRVYTLLTPEFYSALERYNINNSQNPLFLLQEIWPEEHPDDENYF